MHKVSVIIPTKDRPESFLSAIESVLRQTVQVAEIVAVNDASTLSYGNTVSAISRMLEGIDPPPLFTYRVLDVPTGGALARNLGVKASSGDILMFLDDDDTWEDCKVARQLAIFEAQPDVGLVYSGKRVVDEEGRHLYSVRPTASGDLGRLLLSSNPIGTTSAVALRRSVFDLVDGFDPELPGRQDYDLWIRATRHCKVAFDSELTVNYLQIEKPGKQMSSQPKRFLEATNRLLNKYADEYSKLPLLERRLAFASHYTSLSSKFSRASYVQSARYALQSLILAPSMKAASFLLPYSLRLRLRKLGR